MNPKRYGRRTGLLGDILETLPGKVASHWLVQGMTYMDATERRFKLGLDAAIAAALLPILATRLNVIPALVFALILAHTTNFLVNGHIRGALKWHMRGAMPRVKMQSELIAISRRLVESGAIERAYLYGSFSRGDEHPGSDIDIRVVRKPGGRAAFASCLVAMAERARSLTSGVPIDIYVWDSSERLLDMSPDEVPIDLREFARLPTDEGR